MRRLLLTFEGGSAAYFTEVLTLDIWVDEDSGTQLTWVRTPGGFHEFTTITHIYSL